MHNYNEYVCVLWSHLSVSAHIEALLHVIMVGSVSVDVSHSAVTPFHPAVVLQSLIYSETQMYLSVSM